MSDPSRRLLASSRLFTVSLSAILGLAGCAPGGRREPAPSLAFAELPSPAPVGSGEPALAVSPDGGLGMSWLEARREGGHALRWATLAGDVWTEPLTIAQGDSFLVNWADFPAVRVLADGGLVAHWLWKRSGGHFAYDVRVSFSRDGGRSWTAPIVPHDDGTATEHGFVSLTPAGSSALAVWLDGREYAGKEEGDPGARTQLRRALLAADAPVAEPEAIDAKVCDCCQTSAVRTPGGVLVAYRDRTDEEVRDISLVRWSTTGGWSAPYAAFPDNWKIAGCPVNGPALGAREEFVALAWYTEAADTPRVYCALSSDEGATFAERYRIDDGQPAGRVDVVCLDGGSALVSWLEKTPEGAAISVRRVGPDGVGSRSVVAPTSSARKSGFPRMAQAGDAIFLAWTDVSDSTRVRVARAAWGAGQVRR